MRIAPSMLAADFARLKEEIQSVTTADWLHIDIMDGHFVPNLTIGPDVVNAIRPHTKLFFDTHLMIENPDQFIDAFIDAGSDAITIHYEALENPEAILEKIKGRGVKAGISIKPNTPVAVLSPFLAMVDLVLIMSVEPGFGGQAFIEHSVEKIAWLAKQKQTNGYKFRVSVDGGINEKTALQCMHAGADILVAGSYIFKADNRTKAIRGLRHGR